MSKINGLIWIDKNSPNRLKYKVNDKEYEVLVASNYVVDLEILKRLPNQKLYRGTVVAMNAHNQIDRALFPDDVENIIGVALNTATIDNPVVAINTIGYTALEGEALENIFLPEDLDVTTNKWATTSSTSLNQAGIGAPVYWFIGKTTKQQNQYNYIDSLEYPGHLTFATPSGYKWLVSEVDDNSLNIGYDNLPQIGTVSSYKLEGNKIVSLEIHINLGQFDSSLEWNWPYMHYTHTPEMDGDCGKIEKTLEIIPGGWNQTFKDIELRHGLFADNNLGAKLRNYCDVVVMENPIEGKEYNASVGTSNVIDGSDRKTILHISTPETFYYRVSGRINYKFDKEHPEKVED